jgi:hypothetical protein
MQNVPTYSFLECHSRLVYIIEASNTRAHVDALLGISFMWQPGDDMIVPSLQDLPLSLATSPHHLVPLRMLPSHTEQIGPCGARPRIHQRLHCTAAAHRLLLRLSHTPLHPISHLSCCLQEPRQQPD